MENLEKYIRSHRDSFDEREPLGGHFDRFQHKIETRKPARRINLALVAAAAAFAGIVLTGTLGVVYNNSSLNQFNKNELMLSMLSPELSEVENYYNGRINEKYNQINNLTKKSSPEVASEVTSALKDMTFGYYLLKKDLLNNPNQERVKNAMIEQYQVRIDMLDQILDTLKNLNYDKGK